MQQDGYQTKRSDHGFNPQMNYEIPEAISELTYLPSYLYNWFSVCHLGSRDSAFNILVYFLEL